MESYYKTFKLYVIYVFTVWCVKSLFLDKKAEWFNAGQFLSNTKLEQIKITWKFTLR